MATFWHSYSAFIPLFVHCLDCVQSAVGIWVLFGIGHLLGHYVETIWDLFSLLGRYSGTI